MDTDESILVLPFSQASFFFLTQKHYELSGITQSVSAIKDTLTVGTKRDVISVQQEGDTPLHTAARVKGGERCAEMLLKSGADVNARNEVL
jgi:hypothetical protein